MKRINVCGLFVLSALATAAPVDGQRGPGRESARSGVWGGLGVGYGSLSCEDCDDRTSGFSGMGIIGGTLSDVVRLGGGGSSFFREEDESTLTIGTGMAIVQVFPGRGDIYLQGGAGFASAEVEVGSVTYEDEGAAFQVGVGYSANLGERGKVAIVPFANWTFTSIDFEPEFFQIGVGFFWN
ncbi:MAG: outer membrane beta-barrel protein [Gemmatimonadota bacterium]|nr:outer membrane beta-barrel protein [Gemmatimonadota bacterium]